MADISFPETVKQPQMVEWGLRSNTWTFASPLSGSVRTVGIPGARWMAALTWPSMHRDDAVVLQALLVRLRGMENRLLMHDLSKPVLRGSGGGTPVVNGASQTGSSIILSGLPATTLVYKAGDMLGIGGELKMVTTDATSTGGGALTVQFEPPLRASPSNGSAVTTSKPQARFVPADNSVRWLNEPARIVSGFTLELIEAFV
jgi:hypothetical protein